MAIDQTRGRSKSSILPPKLAKRIRALLKEARAVENKLTKQAGAKARGAKALRELQRSLEPLLKVAKKQISKTGRQEKRMAGSGRAITSRTKSKPEVPAPSISREEDEGSTLAPDSMWRRIAILHEDGGGRVPARQFYIFECVDADALEDAEVRIWGKELIDGEYWSLVDGYYEDGELRLEFPPDRYMGLPLWVSLERPYRATTGQTWYLKNEQRERIGRFIVKAVAQGLGGDRVQTEERLLRSGGPIG